MPYQNVIVSATIEATYTWTGTLPSRSESTVYSCKVFLGGVPWDLSEQTLEQAFSPYGPIRVEWPGKEHMVSQPKGFAYVIFDCEKKVGTKAKYIKTVRIHELEDLGDASTRTTLSGFG